MGMRDVTDLSEDELTRLVNGDPSTVQCFDGRSCRVCAEDARAFHRCGRGMVAV